MTSTSIECSKLQTTQYAQGVVAGLIITSKKVFQACKRHLNDLNRQGTKSFPFIFDENKGYYPVGFIEEFCKPSMGDFDKLELQPWQHFIVGSLYGWVHKDTGVRRFTEGLIFMGRKNGKALAVDTPIDTPNGWTTMGELKPGEYVYDIYGKPTKIIATSGIMHNHECFRVVFEDGEEIIADADHTWTVMTKASRRTLAREPISRARRRTNFVDGAYFNITTKEMVGDFVRERVDGKGREYKYRVPIAAEVEHEEKGLPLPPYVLGAWLGDGDSAGAKISLSPKDDELLDHIRQTGIKVTAKLDKKGLLRAHLHLDLDGTLCGRGHLKADHYSNHRCRACEREIDRAKRKGISYSKRKPMTVTEVLRELGVKGNKRIPDIYLRSSIEQRRELLKGLMDTDGHVEKHGQCEFVQKSKLLIDDFSELLSSLGIKHSVREKEAKCNGVSAGTVYSVLFYVDKSKSCFKMKRKHERLKDSLADRMSNKSIVSIEPHVSVPVQCIAVESEKHLFLAGRRRTATHNTALVSGLSLFGASKDGERGARVYQLANSKEQARDMFDECKAMIKASPLLRKHFDETLHEIRFRKTMSKILPLATDSKKLDGKNCSMGAFDEIHEYKTYKLINVIKNSTGARKQPMILYITTAGYQLDGPLMDYYDKSADVLEGVYPAEHIFYFMAELDPEDDLEDPENWIKANPNLGVTIKMEDMLKEWSDRKHIPAERNDFITKRLNRFVQSDEQSFVDFEILKANDKSIEERELEGMPCIGSFDLSQSEDFTSACLEFWLDDGRVAVISHSWVPQRKVELDNEGLPFQEWKEEGLLSICEGRYVKYEEIYDWFVKQSEKFHIELIGFDPANAFRLVEDLKAYGFETLIVRQGPLTLSPALKDAKEMLIDGKVVFNNNPLFRWYMNNVKLVEDSKKNWMPTKQGRYRKIDGFAAFLNSHTEVMKKMAIQVGGGNIEFISINDL